MKRRSLFLYLAIALLCTKDPAFSRDINLDAIYLDSRSPAYARLIEKKLDAYQAAQSQFIDRNVIFAVWIDGITVLYIREVADLNIVTAFNRNTRSASEMCRIEGTIVAVKPSSNGKYLFIKRLRQGKDLIPFGETVTLDTAARTVTAGRPSYPFIDFSLSASGNALLTETSEGIQEFSPDTGSRMLVLKKSSYADIASPGTPALAYFSPNGTKTLILSGSGGSYRSKLITPGASWLLEGVTSASEISWINNNQFIYRSGGPGNYLLKLYDTTKRNSSRLVDNSLNTNLQFSGKPKMAAFLKDQIIQVFDIRKNDITTTGLEGEDVLFSPDGNRFLSLFQKRLFIANFYTVKKKSMELIKNSREILGMYRALLSSRDGWANDYTGDYLRKKIAVYQKITE